MMKKINNRTRAQVSRSAIQRLYIAMRHLFIRGSYKPLGVSGETMIEALIQLSPEIYGSITDPERVELDGLLYVCQRLPRGIEECRFVKLISREGYERSHFQPIIPPKRRRNSYRIDEEQIFIEMTRGRSDIYDILTHLTFMYIEAEKIKNNSLEAKGHVRREWSLLEEIVEKELKGEEYDVDVAYSYLSTLLGRTYEETVEACQYFSEAESVNSIFHITYWLGKLALEEERAGRDREISFSSALREKTGHHYHGEIWAKHVKQFLANHDMLDRPLHLVSANLHSVMNTIYGPAVLGKRYGKENLQDIAAVLSDPKNQHLREKVESYALKNGMYSLEDTSGMNILVQVFDLSNIDLKILPAELSYDERYIAAERPIIVVIDYAFGEQAYEVMDELLKPYQEQGDKHPLNVVSIAIMGKAGILEGRKGDIMIPNAHVFEGTADNYPFKNQFKAADFEESGLNVLAGGPMITVLGTSLQNKDILRYFKLSSWRAIGLEMEGAHYQKAIQGASRIRKSIKEEIELYYAYYASDNPLISGQTLASGSLGLEGVKPTYLITTKILNKLLTSKFTADDKRSEIANR